MEPRSSPALIGFARIVSREPTTNVGIAETQAGALAEAKLSAKLTGLFWAWEMTESGMADAMATMSLCSAVLVATLRMKFATSVLALST